VIGVDDDNDYDNTITIIASSLRIRYVSCIYPIKGDSITFVSEWIDVNIYIVYSTIHYFYK